jgi:hypothetical protein
MLSPRQFGELGADLQSKGGFSVNINTGARPITGYMVSDPQGEEKRPLSATRGKHIEAYARQHEQALQGPGRYLGGWADKDVAPHQAYLDRSTRYPESKLGRSQGFVNMVANFQKSMYHIDQDATVPNPAQPQDKPVDLAKSMRRMRGENVA